MNEDEETQAANALLDGDQIDGLLIDWIIVGRFKTMDGTTSTNVVPSDNLDYVTHLGLAQVIAHSAAKRLHQGGGE